MTTKAIKDIPPDVWNSFKSQAGLEGKKLSDYFSDLVHHAQEQRRSVKKIWEGILSSRSEHPELFGKTFDRRVSAFRKSFSPRRIS